MLHSVHHSSIAVYSKIKKLFSPISSRFIYVIFIILFYSTSKICCFWCGYFLISWNSICSFCWWMSCSLINLHWARYFPNFSSWPKLSHHFNLSKHFFKGIAILSTMFFYPFYRNGLQTSNYFKYKILEV